MYALGESILAVQLFALAAWLVSIVAGRRLLGSYKAVCAAAALTAALALASPRILPGAGTAFAGAEPARAALTTAATARPGAAVVASGPGTASAGGATEVAAALSRAAPIAALCLSALGALLFSIRAARFAAWSRSARLRSELFGREGGIEYRTWDGPACSFGMARPVVLLPVGREDGAEAMRLHETAHIALGHVFWNFLQSMLADLFWFNPAFRAIERRGREEREFEADEAAMRGMGKADYAASLVAEAESAAACPTLASPWQAGLAERVKAIREGRGKPTAAVLVPLPLVALLCAAAAAPIAGSEAVTAAPVPAIRTLSGTQASSDGLRFLPDGCRVIDTTLAVKVTQPFGEATDPLDGSKYFHNGIDLTVPGDPRAGIVAWDSGRVSRSGFDETYGNFIEIIHEGGYSTLYSKLSSRAAEAGDSVARGQRIGVMGSTGLSTGPHLHFVISKDGEAQDPSPYL
jgi:murein DD-endopeptidase MepM/ murein hydrolase activator NlpD